MKVRFSFAAFVLASLLPAQTNEQLHKQFDELKAAVAAQDAASARQTFEKAAFAEEHERDFEKAAKLYGAAAAAAQSNGDQALAAEAKAALRRLETRVGKGSDTKPAGQDIPIAVQRRLFLLVKQLSSPKEEGDHKTETKNYEAMNQLTPFGAVAVPILERALNAETIEDPDENAALLEEIKQLRDQGYTDTWPKLQELLMRAGQKKSSGGGFRGSTKWAAQTLSQMADSEAAAALMRGLRSPDPFVRTTVVGHAWAPRHRALLDEAVKDPSLAGLALTRLSYAKDAALGDLMKSAVYRDDQGGPAAMKWLVRNRRDEALAAAKSGKIRGDTLRAGLEEIVGEDNSSRAARGISTPRSSVEIESKLPVILEIGEAIQEPTHVLLLIESVNRLIGSSSQFDPALKSRLEAIALRTLPEAIKENSIETIMKLLGNIGGLPTARALLSFGKGPVEDTSFESIRRILSRVPSSQFVEAVDLAKHMVARTDAANTRRVLIQLFQQLRTPAQGATVEDLIEGFNTLDEDQRLIYLDDILLKLDRATSEVFVRILGMTGNDASRFRAAQRLANYGSTTGEESALTALVAALSDPSDQVRQRAAQSIGSFGSSYQKRLIELVERQVEAHSADPSNELVRMIGRMPGRYAMPVLEGLWKSAPSQHPLVLGVMLEWVESDAANAFLVKHFDEIPDGLKAQAIERFGKAVYEPAIEVIGSQLASRDEIIRSRAQAALAIFKTQREAVEEFNRWKTGGAESRASIGELMKLLDSTNKDVVLGAVKALGAVRAQSALPALVKLLERNDPALKAAVDEAIKRIAE